MSVSAVQNYENRNPLSTIITATAMGGLVGYGAKYAIPLTDKEKKDINYRAVITSSRKDVNLQKINSFKILKNRTPAKDEFIKMVETKDSFRNPTMQELAERVGGNDTELGKKVIAILANPQNKGIKKEQIIELLGKDTKEAKEFKYASRLNNCFAEYNVKNIVRKLGGEESDSGREFRRIIEDVNYTSSKVTKKILKLYHDAVKSKRYTVPLVVAGATAGFVGAFIHNVFSYKTEA